MSFWNSEMISGRVMKDKLITPFRPDRVKNAAYELGLGNEAYVTSSADGKKTLISAGGQLVVPPGQFGLLLTEEAVEIPAEAIGLISIKASVKFKGLVNVSGFHVDPGYKGKLKFSVYNAGVQNIVLDQGNPLFLLWFCDLNAKTKDIYTNPGKDHISGRDVMEHQGNLATPAALQKKIEELETRITRVDDTISKIIVGVAVAVIGGWLAYFAGWIVPPWSREVRIPAGSGHQAAIPEMHSAGSQITPAMEKK